MQSLDLMGRKNIDRRTIYYWFLQVIWTRANFKLFYRKIFKYNRNRIPRNEPVIMVANHQNALMDALAFASEPGQQRIFLTRADVFNKPLVEQFLYSIKMLPIFRIRDGRESLRKNEEIFELAVNIVNNKRCPLFLFPEGNHGDRRRLRPLVKGIFRIAFKAQEKYGNKPGVKIMPAGVDYEHYQKFGKSITVIYGEPIEVCEYWDEFQKNAAIGTNLLRERLASEMTKWMIDIQTEEFYETYMELREIYRPTLIDKLNLNANNALDRFNTDKELIKSLDETLESSPDKLQSLKEKVEKYTQLRKKSNLREWVFRKPKFSTLGAVFSLTAAFILSPVVIFGLINNWPIFFIPAKFSRTKIKDTQFQSTAAFGLGLVLQIIYYPILITLGFLYLPNVWLQIAYIPLIPLSIKAAYSVWRLFIKSLAKLRYNFSASKLSDVKNLREEIINDVNAIIK